ncbi:MAG: repeat-containing protein [Acidobacteria bacterium]|nr:repeat-containing protein [Acidobacteriota bacterium]
MFRKYSLLTLLAVAVFAVSAIVSSAQVGALNGHVKLKQADGTTVLVAGAVVDVFRTDISGKYETKTDKKGEFRWAGLPYTGTYIIAVSAPGAQPNFQAEVKAGREVDYNIVLEVGDGKRLTLDEIKTILKGGTRSSSSGPTAPAAESGGDKVKRAEVEAKNRELIEKNRKAEDSNKVLTEKFKLGNTSLTAGKASNRAGKYDEAIKLFDDAVTQYDEGIAADQTHPSAPTLMTNKAQALIDRGTAKYNSTIKSEAYVAANKAGGAGGSALLEPARKDWKDAAEVSTKAVEGYKSQSAPTDPADLANFNLGKLFALMVRFAALSKVVTKVDPTQLDAGVAAYDEYAAVETDAARKALNERDLAKMLFDANAYDKAKPAYQKILAQTPDDADALQNMGLTLYNLGFVKEGEGKKDEAKANYQEAANYLQQFVDKTTNSELKIEAQAILQNLKEQQNVQAEKSTAPARRRRP